MDSIIRNRILIVGIGLIIIICWLIFFLNSKDEITPLEIPASGGLTSTHFSVENLGNYDALPEKIAVYKFVNPNITEKDAEVLAKKYSNLLENEATQYDATFNALIIENDQAFFEIEKDTGKFTYKNMAYNPDIAGVVPSDQEVSKLAEDYLKSKNDLPSSFEQVGIAMNTVQNGSGDVKVSSKVVTFYRKINGVPVLGVSKLLVEVGYEGQIVSVKKYYKEVEKDKLYDLKGVKQAIQEFKTNKAVHTIPEGVKAVVLENVTLAYYEDAGTIDEQPYLQPVYHFEGTYESKGKTERFSGVLPALANKYTE